MSSTASRIVAADILAQDEDVIGVVGGLRSGANAARWIAPSTSGVLPR